MEFILGFALGAAAGAVGVLVYGLGWGFWR